MSTEFTSAGISYRTRQNRVLLMHSAVGRGWELPWGSVEDGESPLEAAKREAFEETGERTQGALQWSVSIPTMDGNGGVGFGYLIDNEFLPRLGREHDAAIWFPVDELPNNILPEAAAVLSRWNATLIDVAEGIENGKFLSPQKYFNVFLFDMRISGTGVIYRENDERNELAYRDPTLWLTPEQLRSWQGVPVVIDHPDTAVMTSDYARSETVGSVMLPYVKEDELWGICRIQDDRVARTLEAATFSTSPGVVNGKNTEEGVLESGENFIIEASPHHPDHLAICLLGQWDKDGVPRGIRT